jgi:hypothetical protein
VSRRREKSDRIENPSTAFHELLDEVNAELSMAFPEFLKLQRLEPCVLLLPGKAKSGMTYFLRFLGPAAPATLIIYCGRTSESEVREVAYGANVPSRVHREQTCEKTS